MTIIPSSSQHEPTAVQRKMAPHKPQKASARNTIELKLFAPTIDAAALVADFTGWRDRAMTKGSDGFFRIAVPLKDGEYLYQFRVKSKSWFWPGQWVSVTDPYATKVNERTKNATLKIKDGKIIMDEYVWKHDDKPLPPNNQLVIYELHVADFSGGEADPNPRGRFKHVTEKLPYLKDLGINCIELMPVKEFPGDYSWGYTPLNIFAPEAAYGPSQDLKELIDEAHGLGIRVIFDGIYNHAHTDTPLAHVDHDYWFHHEPKDKSLSWGPQYNYELWDEKLKLHPARKLVGDSIEHWVREFHADGIRYDAAKQIENFDALRGFRHGAINAAGPKPFINIAEYLPEDPAVTTGADPVMDATWQDQFYWRLAETLAGEKEPDLNLLKQVIDPLSRGFTDNTQVVNYISNHDHSRLMPRLAEKGIFDAQAFARAHLAATVLITAVGIPMIWMGQEFADYHPKSIAPQKIDWTVLKNEPNTNLHNHYRRLIQLKTSNEALQLNHINFFHQDDANGILGYVRWNDHGRRVVVIANFKDTPHENYHVPNFPEAGAEWHDWIADRKVNVSDDGLHTNLGGLEAKVLVWD